MGIKTRIFGVVLIFFVISLILSIIFQEDIKFLLENKVVKEKYNIKFEEEVALASEEFGVPKDLIFAIIKTESDFIPDAVSKAGAKGLMQLMPDTFSWISLRLGEKEDLSNIYNVKCNIRYGTYYLSFLIERLENDEAIYAAYNAGYNKVKSWLADSRYSSDGKTLSYIPYTETKNYVKKVSKARSEYKNLLSDKSK